MLTKLVALGLMILLGGRTTRSMSIAGDGIATNSTNSQNHGKAEIGLSGTDQSIYNVLVEIANRTFKPDDSHLIKLIEKGIVEAARSNPSAAIEAGAKKAQAYVTDVTSAYTQAIFRANSAQEAEDILLRFQHTIQRIVEYTKSGDYAS